MKRYIHYGSEKFDKDRFKTFSGLEEEFRNFRNKPGVGVGIWASPVDAEYGWREWCENEDFYTEKLDRHFEFTLKPDAKILTVTSVNDVEDYLFYSKIFLAGILDFEKISKDYDGMEIIHGDNYTNLHDDLFYTWDCDSIVIWNKDVIEA